MTWHLWVRATRRAEPERLVPESQGQNLALTVVYVPYSDLAVVGARDQPCLPSFVHRVCTVIYESMSLTYGTWQLWVRATRRAEPESFHCLRRASAS